MNTLENINNIGMNGELYANKIQKNQNMTNNFIKVRIFLDYIYTESLNFSFRLYNRWLIELACPIIDYRLWKSADYETLSTIAANSDIYMLTWNLIDGGIITVQTGTCRSIASEMEPPQWRCMSKKGKKREKTFVI